LNGLFQTTMDYRIKKVGDEWMFIPQKERDEKKDYERLITNIERKEKKINGMLVKLKEEKKLLKELKKKRTIGYNKMVKYHKKFNPKFSVILDVGKKYVEYKSGNYSETSGNNQWGIYVSVGSRRKYVYLGTVNTVSYHLDLLENHVPHYNKNNKFKDVDGYYGKLKPTNSENDEHRELIKSKLVLYVGEYMKKVMLDIIKKRGDIDTFFDKSYKIKGTDILYDVYKKSPHFQPPQKERERKKGGRLRSLSVGKMKNG